MNPAKIILSGFSGEDLKFLIWLNFIIRDSTYCKDENIVFRLLKFDPILSFCFLSQHDLLILISRFLLTADLFGIVIVSSQVFFSSTFLLFDFEDIRSAQVRSSSRIRTLSCNSGQGFGRHYHKNDYEGKKKKKISWQEY